MKIAVITDQHAGVGNDAEELYLYQMKFYNNTFFPYLEENNIKMVINCGDFMDRRKYVNYKTLHRFRTEYVMRLIGMGVTVHNIIGNHDCYHKNTNEVNSIQELFSNIPNFHIYPDPTEVCIDGVDLLFMPWICQDNTEQCMKMIQETEAKIVFGHLELNGFELYRNVFMHEGLSPKVFNKFDAVYSGHYHHKSSKGNIHYLGAACEYTWSDYSDDRGFHVFDTVTKQMEYVRNPYRLFHKISYDDSSLKDSATKKKMMSKFSEACEKYEGCRIKVIVTKKTDGVLFEEFMDKLYKANPSDVNILDGYQEGEDVDLEDVSVDTMSQDTLSILNASVANNTVLDNDEKLQLNNLIRTIYHEAIAAGGANT